MMRAVVWRAGELVVRGDVPEPVPAVGQVLIEVLASGICGSDVHFTRHAQEIVALSATVGGLKRVPPPSVDLNRDVFMGHEFCGRVLDVGPDTRAPTPGTLVTALPVLISRSGISDLAYSNDWPGGYSERMIVSAPLMLPVPAQLDPKYAAMTEPVAVAIHAVNRSGIDVGDTAIVLGCGPVGLCIVAALRRRGVDFVVASDLSGSRRDLARAMGATLVVDPNGESVYQAARTPGRTVVIFEAIGLPRIIDGIWREAPARSRVVVVGVCTQRDAITPYYAITKELDVLFSLAYDQVEFRNSLAALADGTIDVAPLITGQIALDEVPAMFGQLSQTPQHGKVIVIPGSS